MPRADIEVLGAPSEGWLFLAGMNRGFLEAGGICSEARRLSSTRKVEDKEGMGILEGTAQPARGLGCGRVVAWG